MKVRRMPLTVSESHPRRVLMIDPDTHEEIAAEIIELIVAAKGGE